MPSIFINENKPILIHKAQAMCEKAYAVYSNFKVGSSILTDSGNIYGGCNIENSSFGLTICAERNAIFQAIAIEGPTVKIKIVTVATTDNIYPCSPCGACRQVIAEFGEEAIIIYKINDKWEEYSIKTLLPNNFKMK